MRRILMLLTMTLVMATMMAISALPALAQVPPHRHFLATPGTTTEISRGIACAAHQPAFTNFHEVVHTGAPGAAFADNPVSISATTNNC